MAAQLDEAAIGARMNELLDWKRAGDRIQKQFKLACRMPNLLCKLFL